MDTTLTAHRERHLRPAAVLAILIISCCLLGCTNTLFLHPMKDHQPNPLLARFTVEDVWFDAKDGVKLHAWRIRPQGLQPRGTVVYFHGNAENISTHVSSVLWLVAEGYELFAPDYRGYGRSGGDADVAGANDDAVSAIDRAWNLPGARHDAFYVIGQSLGGAIAVYAVANSPHRPQIKAVVLDSAFSGYRQIAREKAAASVLLWPAWPLVPLLVSDEFSPSRWIDRIADMPVLFIHGKGDPVVSHRHSLRMNDAIGGRGRLVLTWWRGHTQSLGDAAIRRIVSDFLEHPSSMPAIHGGAVSTAP